MRRIICTLGALTTLSMGGCALFPHQDPYTGLVQAVEADDVVRCQYLGQLGSSSGLTGLFAPKGVDNIKNNLLHQADTLGATHVVWDRSVAGYDSTTLTGKAYICPKKTEK